MKSSLEVSTLAVLTVLCLGATAAAQYSLNSPTVLPASGPTAYPLPAPAGSSHWTAFAPAQVMRPQANHQPAYPSIYPAQQHGYHQYPATQGNLSGLTSNPPSAEHIVIPSYQTPQLYGHGGSAPLVGPSGATSSYGAFGGCASYPPVAPAVASSPWFASVSTLLMKPDRANPYYFSYDRDNEAFQLTATQGAEIQWGSGFDVRLGRYFNCGRNAVEAVYWGLFPNTEITIATADSTSLGNLDAILNFSDLIYNGFDANTFTDGAEIHQLWHDHEYHNLEINLLSFLDSCHSPATCGKAAGGCSTPGKCAGRQGCASCCSPQQRHRYIAGVRWFKLNNSLLFGADTIDREFTFAPEEIFYNIDLDNNLIGFQLGCEGEYCLNPYWTFDYGVKLGVYGNNISHTSEIGGTAGVATIDGGPNDGVAFFVDNKKKDIAMLGEANFGIEYRLNRCWTASFGYRALALTGVALPSNQIWHDLRGIQDVQQVDSNGSMILHGGYFGTEYNY